MIVPGQSARRWKPQQKRQQRGDDFCSSTTTSVPNFRNFAIYSASFDDLHALASPESASSPLCARGDDALSGGKADHRRWSITWLIGYFTGQSYPDRHGVISGTLLVVVVLSRSRKEPDFQELS